MRCTQCDEVNAWTMDRCRNCGAPLAASGTPLAANASTGAGARGEGPPYRAPAAHQAAATPGAGPAAITAFAFDARRWAPGDRVTGAATLILLVSLFLPWYGTSNGLFSVSLGGLWHGYMIIDLILAAAILGYLVLRAGFGSVPGGLSAAAAGNPLAGAAGVNLLLAAASFLTKPDGTGWEYGAYLGLAAAVVAVIPPVRSVLAGRHG